MFVGNTLVRVRRKGKGRPWYNRSKIHVIFVTMFFLFKYVTYTTAF